MASAIYKPTEEEGTRPMLVTVFRVHIFSKTDMNERLNVLSHVITLVL